jgi:hypothetical protein
MSKQEEDYGFLALMIIVIIIVVSILTFGKVDFLEEPRQSEAEKQLGNLKARHRRLKLLIEQKEELNKKINRKFKRIYFGVRFVLASIYLGLNAFLYFVFNVRDIGEILSWNELALLVLALSSFLAFGTFASVKDFVHGIKMKLEVGIFRKHISIENEILEHKNEINKLTATITKT